jgi:hypothetical protein
MKTLTSSSSGRECCNRSLGLATKARGCPFGHLKHKLWPKERSGVKLTVWLPTTKSWDSTQFPCVQVTCDISLESSQQAIQLCFKPHHNHRSAREVMCPQSRGSPSCVNFETPSGQKAIWMWPLWRNAEYTIGGRWWLPPSLGRDESCVSKLPVARLSTKSAPTMH